LLPIESQAAFIAGQYTDALLQEDELKIKLCRQSFRCDAPRRYNRLSKRLAISGFRNVKLSLVQGAIFFGFIDHFFIEEKFTKI
jgi:hypothetical protein